MDLAEKVVDKMISNDSFSKWLGIKVIDISNGFCKLQMNITEEMTNGFNIAHGGISYSLADSALAFAANSDGIQSLSIETSISHIKKINLNDTIIAETYQLDKNNKYATYKVKITNQDNVEVAIFKGKVYRTKNKWFSNE